MNSGQVLKLELMEWLASVQDHTIFEDLAKWRDDRQRVNIEQYNDELDEADAAIDRGEFVTHEELKRQMKEW